MEYNFFVIQQPVNENHVDANMEDCCHFFGGETEIFPSPWTFALQNSCPQTVAPRTSPPPPNNIISGTSPPPHEKNKLSKTETHT